MGANNGKIAVASTTTAATAAGGQAGDVTAPTADTSSSRSVSSSDVRRMLPHTVAEKAVYDPPPVVHTSKRSEVDFKEYVKFREELFAFSLGEASFDYAERLLAKQPDNPAVMALVAETALLYERIKVPGKRDHWVDRIDVLQRGIDVVKKCMRDHPDYGPCYSNYTLLATKAAEAQHWWRWAQPLGLMAHFHVIQERGNKAIELAETADVHRALGEVNARCAPSGWYSWYHIPRRYYGLPSRQALLEQSKVHHLRANELNPKDLENAVRLAMVYFHLGEFNDARRWYVRVRDEMVPSDPKDEIWQGIAHTALCTHFEKTKWSTPFG